MDIRFVSDLGVNVHAQMYAWPVLQVGKTSGGKLVPIAVDADGNLAATIATGDIEIGAVELKDAGTDTRANILAANTARTTATVVVAVQAIDEAGGVLKTSTLATQTTLAAVLAKQPALGTQTAPSADVLTTINPRFSVFTNIAANTTLNVKAAAGNVFAVCCANSNAATRYLQLHNTTTVPAVAAVPVYSFPIFAGGSTIIGTDFFGAAGVAFSTGIAFAVSTTRDTYTAATAGDHSTVVHYI